MSLIARLLRARTVSFGAFLYMGMRWVDRGLGVLSTVVLARLLTPDDFGLVALTSVVVGLISMALDLGVPIRIVQMQNFDEEDLDTGWTIQFIELALMATVLAILAPVASNYYGDPRLYPVLQVYAISFCFAGFNNLAPIIFQKRREYAREVIYFVAKRGLTFIATILLAFYIRNYWALVAGSFIGTVFGVGLSYWMLPRLRKPTLQHWRKFAGSSVWLTAQSIGKYASEQVDKLVLGKVGGATGLGTYALADQIAAMPSSELLQPMNRALYPVLAQKQAHEIELRRIFLMGLGVQATIALPASIGLALVSEEVIEVMLGEKWRAAVPLLSVLALCYGLNAISSVFGALLTASGKFRSQALISWGNLIVFSTLLFVALDDLSLEHIAELRLATAAIFAATLVAITLIGTRAISLRSCLSVAWRPVVASALMGVLISLLWPIDHYLPSPIRLFIEAGSGAVSYISILLLLWLLVGKPDGAEAWLISVLKRVIQNRTLFVK